MVKPTPSETTHSPRTTQDLISVAVMATTGLGPYESGGLYPSKPRLRVVDAVWDRIERLMSAELRTPLDQGGQARKFTAFSSGHRSGLLGFSSG